MGFMSTSLGQVGSTNADSSFFGGGSGTFNPGTPTSPGTVAAGATSLGSTTASSVQAAQNIGFSTPSNIALPSFLTTNPDSLQKELADQYSTAGASILTAANKAGKKANNDANMAYGQEMREGANATAQQSAVNRQQGGTAKTSSIVAGEMSEDAAKQRTDARVAIAQMKLGATEQAANLSSQIAGQMASLRTSYLGMLAGTSTSQRGQDISQTDFTQSQAQQAAEFAAELRATKTGSGSGGAGYGPPSYDGPVGAGVGNYLGPLAVGGANG